MSVAVDTNLFVYAQGLNGAPRAQEAIAVLETFEAEGVLVPAQVLGELYNLLVSKGALPPDFGRQAVVRLGEAYSVIDTTREVTGDAMQIRIDHKVGWWDAIVLASASAAGCRYLLTEDLQHGFTWRGVTVRNPFAA